MTIRLTTMKVAAAVSLSLFLPNIPALAADKAVLVLDGSGSMWQQVGSTTKIEIARDVIGDLMLDWSDKVELGLSAYGHREKGNCSDIETLKPIGPVDPKEVAQIVDAISPRGKTPLTAAVRKAADELRFEEDRATVILVSDGEETCGGDPCAVARELEAAGIDFTVHVVGFDLTQEETANLQCIADNTGGKFLEAANAEELHQAMAVVKEVVVESAKAPEIVNFGSISLNPKSTFLRTDSGDSPEQPLILDLRQMNVLAGDRILITQSGDYRLGFSIIWKDNKTRLVGVFSKSPNLRHSSERFRITDAVQTPFDVPTGETLVENLPTDINKDFLIDKSIELNVPNGAKYLFIGIPDSQYFDNTDPDGDLSILVSVETSN